MKIAILYIATGRYHVYWDEFYASMKRYFLPGCQRRVLLFTDAPERFPELPDVVPIRMDPLPWPDVTLLRYHLFLEHQAAWADADDVFFINANYRFYHRVDTDILPTEAEGGLVVARHRFSGRKKPDAYPYERRPESTACIPLGQGKHYVAGGFNGGTRAAFLALCQCLKERIQQDRERGVTALWHDESHLNRYVLEHPAKILPATFVWPEEKVRWYNRWRVMAGPRDKRRLGGHDFLRDERPADNPQQPLVSIIMPIYNGERFLQQSLDGVCRQTYRHLEILCVDDGSTDGSRALLQSVARQDPRIRVLPQENQGAAAARNHGLDEATGSYIMFLDCDDLFHPELVSSLVQAALQEQTDITLCQAVSFASFQNPGEGFFRKARWSGRPFPDAAPLQGKRTFHPATDMPSDLFLWAETCPWNKLFRRELIDQHQLRFAPVPYPDDLFFTAYALSVAERVALVPRVLIGYRLTAGSLSHTGRQKYPLTHFEAFSQLYRALCQNPQARALLPAFYRKYIRATMGHLYASGDLSTMELLREHLIRQSEPEFHVLAQNALSHSDPDAYQRYKACIQPRVSVLLRPSGKPGELGECLFQLSLQSWSDMEILLTREEWEPTSLALWDKMASRDPRFHCLGKGERPRGEVVAVLQARAILPRRALSKMLQDQARERAPLANRDSGLIDLGAYGRSSWIARAFMVHTATRFSLSLFFLPLWTTIRYHGYSARFLLGMCLYEREGRMGQRRTHWLSMKAHPSPNVLP